MKKPSFKTSSTEIQGWSPRRVRAGAARTKLKREQIIKGAMSVFLSEGFHGANMDLITAAAGVSKATIYSYFPTKEALFEEICSAAVEQVTLPTRKPPAANDSVDQLLHALAKNYAAVLLSPPMLALHRLGVGEATRFSHLGKVFYRSGPERGTEGIARYLRQLADAGHLVIEDPVLAAHHFWGLTLSAQRTYMLFMEDEPLPDDEIDHAIVAGIDAFLRIYGAGAQSPIRESSSRG